VIQTSITAPCRRDQVADILTGAVLRLLATRAMKPSLQLEDGDETANEDSPELPADSQPAERG
jgi:hypothetical protein